MAGNVSEILLCCLIYLIQIVSNSPFYYTSVSSGGLIFICGVDLNY